MWRRRGLARNRKSVKRLGSVVLMGLLGRGNWKEWAERIRARAVV